MEESAFMKKVAVLVAGVSSSRGQHDRDSAELRRLCGDRDKLKSSLADMTAERDELLAALEAMEAEHCDTSPYLTKAQIVFGRKSLMTARELINKSRSKAK